MWLTEYNEEDVYRHFKEEGREEGIEIGREEGREEGRAEGVCAVVEMCKSLGGSSLDAVEKVVATMGFSQPEADRLVAKYW